MKFFCEYCGNRIDANKDIKCPSCGASYKKNKSYIKLYEERNKEEQQNKEFKQQVINHALGTMKFSKWFMFVPIIIFVVVFSIGVISFININKSSKNNFSDLKNEFDSIFESVTDELDKENENENITVSFNEYGATKNYQVKVTKYEVVEDKFNKAETGYECVKFYLVVENLANKEITKEDVNCIVDGIAQTNDFTSGYSDLPMFIQKGLTVKGTATFIVPKDTNSYDIKYGDNVTIHIEK